MDTLLIILGIGGDKNLGWTYEIFTYDKIKVIHQSVDIDYFPYSITNFFNKNGTILTIDYSIESNSHSCLSYYPLSHPTPIRFLIFDNGKWRADRPQELNNFYKTKLLEVENNLKSKKITEEESSLIAPELSYYCVMMGGTQGQCYKLQQSILSIEQQSCGKELFKGVSQCARSFTLTNKWKSYQKY